MLKIHLENISEVENKSELLSNFWFSDVQSVLTDNIAEDSFAGSIMITGSEESPEVYMETYLEGFSYMGFFPIQLRSSTPENGLLQLL